MTAAGQGHDGPTVRVVVTRCHWCGRAVKVDERGNCSFCSWPRRDDKAVEVGE
jgi:ribosomal protein L37E